MSALRNAISRRAHKERPQPSHRTRFGLLEKHKDYVQRAQDFHKKEQTIRVLKEKAANRNPDEFYFKMISSQTVNGIHRGDRNAKRYTEEELQLMKTQDIGYLMNKAQSERKKVERLKGLHLPDLGKSNKHVFFAEDVEEAKALRPLVVNRPAEPLETPRVRKKMKREMEERSDRAEKLRAMAVTMTLQKQLTGKGRKRKLGPDEVSTPTDQPVYRWRTERKK